MAFASVEPRYKLRSPDADLPDEILQRIKSIQRQLEDALEKGLPTLPKKKEEVLEEELSVT